MTTAFPRAGETLREPKWRSLLVTALLIGSSVLLGVLVAIGISRIPSEIVGGGYSNTDGEWLRWNGEFILRFSDVLDVSPFNAFAGMGSVYLPNLPWLSPGALALALDADLMTVISVSYVLYMLGVGLSLVILARVIGFSWPAAIIAAQLHIIVLFPPFSYFFRPIEWYSAAPMYAQLSTVLNFAMAVFVATGRHSRGWSFAGVAGLAALVVVGLLSAPFSFVFFFPPYVFFGVIWLLLSRPSRGELMWKALALIAAGLTVWALGYPDYLRAMAGSSARTSFTGINWTAVLSLESWYNHLRSYPVCADPRALICDGNGVAWFQIMGLAGAALLAVLGRQGQRILGIWGLLYTLFVAFYAYANVTGWFGTFAFISIHFVSWSGYGLLGICAVGGLWVAVARVGGWAVSLARRSRERGVARWAFASAILVFVLPVYCLTLLPRMDAVARTARIPSNGPILEYLEANGRLELGGAFPGYTTTVWSTALVGPEIYDAPAVYAHLRYVGARHYFDRHYGNTFTETDLWSRRIPTLEEYGQWVSRQAQKYTNTLMGTGDPSSQYDARMLRIYRPDFGLLRTLGVRFVITDERRGEAGMVLRAEQSVPDAFPVFLYELEGANLVTYSPTELIVEADPEAALAWVGEHHTELDRVAVVDEAIAWPLVEADAGRMTLIRDGYELAASSQGRSALLLPLQYTHCLEVSGDQGPAGVQLVRANFLQTLVVFEGEIDISIRNRLGLFG